MFRAALILRLPFYRDGASPVGPQTQLAICFSCTRALMCSKKWMNVAVHAYQILNASTRAIFVTASDLVLQEAAIDHAQADGLKIATVPENVKHSLRGALDPKGKPVRDLSLFQTEWEKSFEFKFVKPENLSKAESEIFRRTRDIAKLVGGVPKRVREIKISETMRPDFLRGNMTKGLWDRGSASIIILR